MGKHKVSELAKLRGVSVQTIYKQIKRGGLNTIKEDGITYVIVDDSEFKPGSNNIEEDVKQSSNDGCNELLKMVKSLTKQVKSLNKQLVKCHESKQDVLIQYIGELKQLRLPPVVADKEDAIDLEPVKKRGKKKKHKGKKKK